MVKTTADDEYQRPEGKTRRRGGRAEPEHKSIARRSFWKLLRVRWEVRGASGNATIQQGSGGATAVAACQLAPIAPPPSHGRYLELRTVLLCTGVKALRYRFSRGTSPVACPPAKKRGYQVQVLQMCVEKSRERSCDSLLDPSVGGDTDMYLCTYSSASYRPYRESKGSKRGEVQVNDIDKLS